MAPAPGVVDEVPIPLVAVEMAAIEVLAADANPKRNFAASRCFAARVALTFSLVRQLNEPQD